jgi:hypothetical protein
MEIVLARQLGPRPRYPLLAQWSARSGSSAGTARRYSAGSMLVVGLDID